MRATCAAIMGTGSTCTIMYCSGVCAAPEQNLSSLSWGVQPQLRASHNFPSSCHSFPSGCHKVINLRTRCTQLVSSCV